MCVCDMKEISPIGFRNLIWKRNVNGHPRQRHNPRLNFVGRGITDSLCNSPLMALSLTARDKDGIYVWG